MSFTGLFIKRPVMTTLLMIGILVFGIVSYRKLPVSDLPTVDYPTISVNANLPGASPETMAATVATPLEKAFSAIAGIDEITSSSSLGGTNVTLQFSLDRDIEAAAQDVNAAIGKTLPFLPSTILPPSYRKQNAAASPIMSIALTSNVMPMTQVDEYAETTIAQRLSMIEGVAQVGVYGAAKYAVRVQVDPGALASRGLGVSQIATAIRNNNVMLPTGVLYGKNATLTLQANGQLNDAADFRRLIVAYKDGAAVRLGDVANVLDDIQNNKGVSWYDNERSVNLMVQRQPGTNTVDVAERVREALDDIERGLPPTLKVRIQYDRSESINRAVADVKFSLLVALVLVVAVIFFFLRSFVATLIPSLTLPLSIIGTFSVMQMLDFSVDNLSLMALTLAVGFVVDDAIVMLENIVRHLEMGKDPRDAALDGAAEVGFTILSMTLSLAAVFIPLMFMAGIIGRLFREFAVTISVAILVSGLVSLTLTPMLCSRLLKKHDHEDVHGAWFRFTESLFDSSLRGYERSLGWVMRHRPLTLVFSAVILGLTGVLWTAIPKGLFPPDDTGSLNATAEAAQGTSFLEMLRFTQLASARVASDTNVASYTANIGSFGGSSNQASFNITLKPAGQRPSADDMVHELTRTMSGIPGLQVFVTNPPAIRIGGRGSKSSYQYTLRGPDITQLYAQANNLLAKLQDDPMLNSVTSDLLNRSPILEVHIDRQRALALGVSPTAIENALANAYNQQQVSTIFTPTNEYWVVMETVPSAQLDASALQQFFVPGSNGKQIPLTDVAYFEPTTGPLSVAHSGQMASVTISFNLAPNVSLGAATDDVNRIARAALPASITGGFAGTAQAFQDSQRGMGLLLLITVFVIYIILGILYESFIHPVTILTGLPFAAFGALLALYLAHVELGVYGYVGIIMLIGIVKKNAIMMIDFAIERERSEHVSPAQAIIEAASVRFRPIMMTTVSAIAGTLPIAIGVGASAASRRPLGVAVVGGLAFSQIVTLYVTPVFYTYFDELQTWFGSRFASSVAESDVPVLGPAHVAGD
ncbi:MAG TPA: efflux RND transporter permease subunit [Gemmatimonadaceae bacterium]|jgi:HAE1 family hydrophobic/amphiphilic exporter-1|nr:efflux RND transporter permease subunit [Gemmatimonadaceae bacterium]